jgi:hypothetical protein
VIAAIPTVSLVRTEPLMLCTPWSPCPDALNLRGGQQLRGEMAPIVSPPWDYCDPYARRTGFGQWDARMILDDSGVTGEWL